MSSTLDFARLLDRTRFFQDCNVPFKNKEQEVFNISIAGFHLKSNSASGADAVGECHVCEKTVKKMENVSNRKLGWVCSVHEENCLFYQKYDAPTMAGQEADVRVVQSSKYEYVDSPSIVVHVGVEPDAKDFTVYEDLICPRSPFFVNALKRPWKESEDRVVPLPEDEPKVFSMYLQFLISDKLPIKDATTSDSDSMADEYTLLGKLFVLAEKLMDDKGKDVILAALAARAKEPAKSDNVLYYPAIETVQIIYDGTPELSPARDLMVDIYTEHVSSFIVTNKSDTLPRDFLRDLSLSLLTKRPVKKEVESLKRARDELEDEVQDRRKRVKALEAEVIILKARVEVEMWIADVAREYGYAQGND